MKLTKGKINKVLNKKHQTVKKYKKSKRMSSSRKIKTLRRKRGTNLRNKTLKKYRMRGGFNVRHAVGRMRGKSNAELQVEQHGREHNAKIAAEAKQKAKDDKIKKTHEDAQQAKKAAASAHHDADEAHKKAENYIQRLKGGQRLSVAFEGKNIADIGNRKSISLREEIIPENELLKRNSSSKLQPYIDIPVGLTIEITNIMIVITIMY